MVVLGLVLIVLVVLLSTAVALSNPEVLDLDLFGAHVPATLGGVFFTGAGAMLVALLGLVLIQRGIVRARRQRKALKSKANAAPAHAPSGRAPRPAARPVASPPATTDSASRRVVPESSSTTSEERAAMLADADQLTRDDLR